MNANLVVNAETLHNVLWVPGQAVFDSDGRTFVWAKSGSGFAPADVKLVRRSESQAVITGISEGQVVALANPEQQAEKKARRRRAAGHSEMKPAAVISIAERSRGLSQYFSDLPLAAENLLAQKIRTALTCLGMVFGVGAVIGMLAIGAGARQESLRFIEELGVRNLLVEARPAAGPEEFQVRRRSSPGLTERDVRILQANIDVAGTDLAEPDSPPVPADAQTRARSAATLRRANFLRDHPQSGDRGGQFLQRAA